MLTEYHCHILPGIDDGAANAEMSLQMVERMRAQGVERIVATPHFYAHRERSVAAYLEKRQAAFEQIRADLAIRDVRLGAEVAIEHGISELEGIEKLAFEGTDLILLELPYRGYAPWMSEEIYNISAEYKLRVILAHVHRYLPYYSKDEMDTILTTHAIMQCNIEALSSWHERGVVKRLIRAGKRLVFGSDAHNLAERAPNWDLACQKLKPEVLAASDAILDRYMLTEPAV